MSIDPSDQHRTPNHAHALTDSAAHMEEPAQEIDWDIDDQTVVYVDQETWDFFVSALDQPVESAGFRKLMQAPVPWEQ